MCADAINVNKEMLPGGYGYGKEKKKRSENEGTSLLIDKNGDVTAKDKFEAESDKFLNSWTVYPARGLKGNRNANFYEFLAMGVVPYIIGSGMLMAVFGGVAPLFKSAHDRAAASSIGKKMSLGVLFYGFAKKISESFLKVPFKLKYGIDPDIPYRKEVPQLPQGKNYADPEKLYEYHKAFESVDFPRWDLFYDKKEFGESRNAWYNEVAKKMGYKEDLPASDQIVKPALKEKFSKLKTYLSLSTFLWAATGVCVACQNAWDDVKWGGKIHGFGKGIKELISDSTKAFVKAFDMFLSGNGNKKAGFAGKLLFASAALLTIAGNFAVLRDVKKDNAERAGRSVNIESADNKAVF